MFRLVRTTLAAVLLVTHLAAFGQTEPAEQYLQCYFQIQEADKLRSEGKVVEAHDKFKDLDFVRAGRSDVVLFDIKGLLPWEQVDGRL